MATLDQIRMKGEADLEKALAKMDRRHRAMVLAAVERYGSVMAVPRSVWEEIQRSIENESAAMLLLLLLAADEWTAGRITQQGLRTGGPTRGQLGDYAGRAAAQAQRLGAVLAQSARDRAMRAEIEGLVTGKSRADITNGVSKELGRVFSKDGREPGVITTTTDTISRGQTGAAERASQPPPQIPGRPLEPPKRVEMIWRTERDDRVCPVCAPLDNVPPMVWGQQFPFGPPAHIGCRCALFPKVELIQVRGAA